MGFLLWDVEAATLVFRPCCTDVYLERIKVGFGFVDQNDITQASPQLFFARPAEVVGPELVGCKLVKRQDDGSLLWGVIVET